MNFPRQICEDFSIAFLPGIHTLIIHRSLDAYNYIWKIFSGIGYGTRNSSEVMPARKRGLCRIIFENSGKVAVVVVFDFCRNTADGKIRPHQLLSKKRTILKRQTENRLPPFISECHTQHPFRSKENSIPGFTSEVPSIRTPVPASQLLSSHHTSPSLTQHGSASVSYTCPRFHRSVPCRAVPR